MKKRLGFSIAKVCVIVRNRAYLAGAIVATVAAGLASRKYPSLLPAALGKYPGDALWAQVVYWGISFLAPSAPIVRVAASALAIASLDEFSQLYQAPWINHIRETTLGHLVLGSEFSWADLMAYTIGVGLCCGIESILFKRGHKPGKRGLGFRMWIFLVLALTLESS